MSLISRMLRRAKKRQPSTLSEYLQELRDSHNRAARNINIAAIIILAAFIFCICALLGGCSAIAWQAEGSYEPRPGARITARVGSGGDGKAVRP